ncbi:hypothetical protein D3C84_436190 [compost metagenome]
MNDYVMALQRMIEGRPIRIAKGSEINRKNVALEAGKDASAIKAGREIFKHLIKDIELAGARQKSTKKASVDRMARLKCALDQSKAEVDQLKACLEESRKQCLMLMQELFVRKKEESHLQSVKPDISSNGRH